MTKRLPCPHTVHAALMDIAARIALIELNEREAQESIERIRQLIGLVFAGRYEPEMPSGIYIKESQLADKSGKKPKRPAGTRR